MKAVLAAMLALVPMLTATAGTAAAREATSCTWTRGTLPPPAGDDRGYVSAAAYGGWFAGSASSAGAIRWHDGVAEVLGHAFGQQTELTDINSSGTAVGMTYKDSFEDNAVVYRDGRFSVLPRPPGRRSARALGVNDAGDIVGTALGLGDNFDLTIWPASAPGTVVTINPDPTVYGYVSPVDIDEQGRILIRAETSTPDFFVRYPDGTMTKIALGTDMVDSFRNGRIAGVKYENERLTTVEWDLTGAVVRELSTWANAPAVDSGTRTTGIYRTADRGYALGVWESGVLTDTLATVADFNDIDGPVIADDGMIAAMVGTELATFRHSCSA
ncbi:hypothetical protein AB5J62_32920 [Amycolatopsis sp. cg5]|uniref:hypothetical protein n=1 Tax=Amycolatopsis sp. cg5 TaxID=3238802 RepID=UPI003526929B